MGDVKQGYEVMHHGDGSTYEGEWAGDAQNGVGEHVWLGPLPQTQAPGSGTAFFLMQNRSACPGVRPPLLGRHLLLWPLLL